MSNQNVFMLMCLPSNQMLKTGGGGAEILTSLSGRNGRGGPSPHGNEIIASRKAFRNPLSANKLNHLSLFTYHSSLPKHICFTLRKLSFRVVKDRLSPSKRPSFATRNIYVWE